MLILQMKRAERYCAKAKPMPRKPSLEEMMEEPTNFYSGASGYAGSTLRCAISTLEMSL